tara:strand:- start:294 stop:623 length:330 start_codon:yes stop_codon:yes gene_type:complete
MKKHVQWADDFSKQIYDIKIIPFEGQSLIKLDNKITPRWRYKMREVLYDLNQSEYLLNQIKKSISEISEDDIDQLIKYTQYMISSAEYNSHKEKIIKNTYKKYGGICPL